MKSQEQFDGFLVFAFSLSVEKIDFQIYLLNMKLELVAVSSKVYILNQNGKMGVVFF